MAREIFRTALHRQTTTELYFIAPRVYLEDIITMLESGRPMARLSELTPGNWFAQLAV